MGNPQRRADADHPAAAEVGFEREPAEAVLPATHHRHRPAAAGVGRDGEVPGCVPLVYVDAVVPLVDHKSGEPEVCAPGSFVLVAALPVVQKAKLLTLNHF